MNVMFSSTEKLLSIVTKLQKLRSYGSGGVRPASLAFALFPEGRHFFLQEGGGVGRGKWRIGRVVEGNWKRGRESVCCVCVFSGALVRTAWNTPRLAPLP